MTYYIIGGGLTGLRVAQNLVKTDPSLDIVLIEKNTYLGGRIPPTSIPGVELGAQWIHGYSPTNPLYTDYIAPFENQHQIKLNICKSDDSNSLSFLRINNVIERVEGFDDYRNAFYNFIENSSNIKNDSLNALKDNFNNQLFNTFLFDFNFGGGFHDLSIHHNFNEEYLYVDFLSDDSYIWLDEKYSMNDIIIQPIFKEIKDKVTILLNREVSSVSIDDCIISLNFTNHSVIKITREYDHLIVTCPIHEIIQRFHPLIEPNILKTDLANLAPMCIYIKCFYHIDIIINEEELVNMLRPECLYGDPIAEFITVDFHGYLFVTIQFLPKKKVLFTYFKKPNEDIDMISQSIFKKLLKPMYNYINIRKINDNISNFHRGDIGGAYSILTPNAPHDIAKVRENMSIYPDNVHFGGEALCERYSGFLNGALRSADIIHRKLL